MMIICVTTAALAAAAGPGSLERKYEDDGLLLRIDDPTMMPSAQEVAASRAAFDERTGASASTWDAILKASSAQARRRTQEGSGSHTSRAWKYDSTALSSGADISWANAMTEPATMDCVDEVAENYGAAEPCQYTCITLKARFLPNAPLAKTRCFIYNRDSNTWPESSATPDASTGAHAAEMSELLSMRQQTQDWHTCKYR